MRPATALLALAFLGCATLARAYGPVPGYGVEESQLAAAGCDQGQFEEDVERYKAMDGTAYPSMGDSLCDVWAKLGIPDDSQMIQTEWGNSLHYTYESGSIDAGTYDVHTVTFDCGSTAADCTVRSVSW